MLYLVTNNVLKQIKNDTKPLLKFSNIWTKDKETYLKNFKANNEIITADMLDEKITK